VTTVGSILPTTTFDNRKIEAIIYFMQGVCADWVKLWLGASYVIVAHNHFMFWTYSRSYLKLFTPPLLLARRLKDG